MADLIELEYALDYAELPRDAKDRSELIPLLISAASATFEGETNRTFLTAAVTEDLKGGRERLLLTRRPVTAFTSVTDRNTTTPVVKPADEYRVDTDSGLIFLVNSTTGVDTEVRWLKGRNRWRVVYTAGYTFGENGTMPDDVKVAVAQLVVVHWHMRNPAESEEERGDWKSRRTLVIPPRVAEVIARYREETF